MRSLLRALKRSPRAGAGHGPEAGYNLVMLVVAITVLNILLAAALPSWSHAIQREKEEELIARGLQYAEAIRVFRARFGRLPVRLEELLEVEPRSIRRLWKDPMTKNGEWGLIFETGGGARDANPQGPQGTPAPGGNPGGTTGGNPGQFLPDPTPGGRGGQDGVETVGPIAGVHSLSDEESIQVWNDKETYKDWLFTYHLLVTAVAVAPGGNAGATPGVPNPTFAFKAEWIGRPFRQGIQPQLPGVGGVPGGGDGPGQGRPGVGPDGRPLPTGPGGQPGEPNPGQRPGLNPGFQQPIQPGFQQPPPPSPPPGEGGPEKR